MSDKDEIYVPRMNTIEVSRELDLEDPKIVRDICHRPIVDFIDEVYVPRKKNTSER